MRLVGAFHQQNVADEFGAALLSFQRQLARVELRELGSVTDAEDGEAFHLFREHLHRIALTLRIETLRIESARRSPMIRSGFARRACVPSLWRLRLPDQLCHLTYCSAEVQRRHRRAKVLLRRRSSCRYVSRMASPHPVNGLRHRCPLVASCATRANATDSVGCNERESTPKQLVLAKAGTQRQKTGVPFERE